jgi:hypothetical protein
MTLRAMGYVLHRGKKPFFADHRYPISTLLGRLDFHIPARAARAHVRNIRDGIATSGGRILRGSHEVD